MWWDAGGGGGGTTAGGGRGVGAGTSGILRNYLKHRFEADPAPAPPTTDFFSKISTETGFSPKILLKTTEDRFSTLLNPRCGGGGGGGGGLGGGGGRTTKKKKRSKRKCQHPGGPCTASKSCH